MANDDSHSPIAIHGDFDRQLFTYFSLHFSLLLLHSGHETALSIPQPDKLKTIYLSPSQVKKSCRVTKFVISRAINPIMANLPFICSAYGFHPKLGVVLWLSLVAVESGSTLD